MVGMDPEVGLHQRGEMPSLHPTDTPRDWLSMAREREMSTRDWLSMAREQRGEMRPEPGAQDWWSMALSVPPPQDALHLVGEQRGEMHLGDKELDRQDWWFSDAEFLE